MLKPCDRNSERMQVMEDYSCKSPDKSSPSFPEDADDDDEKLDENFISFNRPISQTCRPPSESSADHIATDVTMVAEEEEDEMDVLKPISSGMDSPKPTNESTDKKVHWTTRNVQALLDCVEEHLHEFNVQKKHKAVWQAIGAEMEPLGFSTEHCYNKWKNLRRDVRLLVNNPMKAVRNASILRRVARLILVIYPNVDATTMQVCGDRSGVKSTPVTPGGPCSSVKSVASDSRYSGLNSPHCKTDSPNLPRLSTNLYNIAGDISALSTPTTGEKTFSASPKSNSVVPGTALFGNTQCSSQNGDKDHPSFGDPGHLRPPNNDDSGTSQTPMPFPFNPAAAALLLQSQLFTDFFKQQRKSDEVSAQERAHDLTSVQNGPLNVALQQTLTNYPSEFPSLPGLSAASLTASLLNGLVGLTSASDAGQRISDAQNPILSSLPTNLLERFPPSSEIACIVERLQAEEAVHFRLTDMIAHLADELRAAGQRRQATLNHLLSLMKGVGISGNGQTATADAGGIS
ncbi:unnamed protein product [Schistocephalus solidus]|uniref:Myb-like domain-containing protein n=1 Tax=Schistocephalus solidus TaxID=70667 RepID=A0A3P7ENA6_SCHSO|nr:unnamed protein product [Schistocephalus solidus]